MATATTSSTGFSKRVWHTIPAEWDRVPHIVKPVYIPTSDQRPLTIHMFEKAGLGRAPYTFIGCEKRIGPLALPSGVSIGGFGQPLGCCQFCATGIIYLFWLESADKKKFYVGSDCILKSGDKGLESIIAPILAEHQREVREARETYLVQKWERTLAEAPDDGLWNKAYPGPHPYFYHARSGRTAGDFWRYKYQRSHGSTKASIARKALVALGIEQPRRKKDVVNA
jgi:hypothetical protein